MAKRALTTETGRPRIQRQEWQLIAASNVKDFDHVALFVKSKSWTHLVTFLSPCWLRRYSLLFTLRSFGVKYFRGSPKFFNWKFSFTFHNDEVYNASSKAFMYGFPRELEFAFYCLRNRSEYAIDKSRTGMWPQAFTFFVWQTKPRDQNRRRLPPKSTATLVFEFAVYLFR